MVANVVAITPQHFENWLAARKAQIKAADNAAAIQRKQLEKTSP